MSPPPRSRRRDDDVPVPSRRNRKKGRGRGRRRTRRISVILAVLAAIFGIALVAGGFGAAVAFRSSCDLKSLRPVSIGQNSFVYAADNSVLGVIPAERNRQPVGLRSVSSWMPRATVAIEDRRFYEHGGIDTTGIMRALIADIKAGKVVQGGSTITQQLVRNLYISKERTFKRKITEACLAMKLSSHWSKRRILSAYMNQVYYGNHAYGVEAAAETYFSKHASQLTLAQASLIAGLPQAPSIYDPFHRPATALARRDEVLRALLKNRDITPRQYDRVISDRHLHLKAGQVYTRIREPYFFSYVRDELIGQYGANTVRSGGLRVYTTVDPRLQRAAEKAIRDTLYYSTDPSAAVVSINPANGAIRAMTAVTPGKKGKASQFNLAAQARRQPGSTFKVFVLTAAVEQGMDPNATSYVSAPFHCTALPWCIPPWDVSTYDHSYRGAMSVTQATLASDNTVYAQMTLDVGPDNVAEMAHRLGVRTPLKPVASIGLGADVVSPLDLASAYATLAAGGVYSKPMAIRKVIFPNGKADNEVWGKPRRKRVISDGVAWAVTQVLQQNMTSGTGTNANIGLPDAGKTGTTENHADAWFSGYTPRLQATVWVGYPQGEIPMLSVHGIAVAGATFPSTIWHLFMEAAVGNGPYVDFPTPSVYPTFGGFKRSHYALSYVPSTDTSSTSTGGTTTTAPSTHGRTTPRPPPPSNTFVPVPTTTPPPVTTEPPPPVTTEPPPPATTEPPPVTTVPQPVP
ncbi:MAG: penicillin-binding protein [Gaiellaceae bacterium]|nr:penicillin-binding protein [Gaiellaceae bacterium]